MPQNFSKNNMSYLSARKSIMMGRWNTVNCGYNIHPRVEYTMYFSLNSQQDASDIARLFFGILPIVWTWPEAVHDIVITKDIQSNGVTRNTLFPYHPIISRTNAIFLLDSLSNMPIEIWRNIIINIISYQWYVIT